MDDEASEYDMAVIGGGIVGTGIARDAALRGLRVALFEKDDFGSGTTSRSTRLVHGGLRYLEHLELGLVHEALRERRFLLHQAPHLVQPLPFLFPVYRGRGHNYLKLWSGMVVYDFLSIGKRLPHHVMLSADQCAKIEPALRREGLRGGFVYYDAQCPFPERLCVENVLDAAAHGAHVHNHTLVTDLVLQDGTAVGLHVRDQITGEERTVRAGVTINAAGPWIDAFLTDAGVGGDRLVTRSKGIHLVTPSFTTHALIMETDDAKRIFFAIPWHGYTLVGTTDTEYDGDNDGVAADEEDVDYLLRETSRILSVDLRRDQILFTTAGLRALPNSEDRDVGAITRRHVLIDHGSRGGPRGLFSLVGGKITTYRDTAEDVVDRAMAAMGRSVPPSPTREIPLPGAADDWPQAKARILSAALDAGLEPDTAEYLAHQYGVRTLELIRRLKADASSARRIVPGRPEILAEVDFAVETEMARSVIDVLLRRTTLGLSQGVGLAALDVVVDRMAELSGWDQGRKSREKDAYRDRVRRMGPVAELEQVV